MHGPCMEPFLHARTPAQLNPLLIINKGIDFIFRFGTPHAIETASINFFQENEVMKSEAILILGAGLIFWVTCFCWTLIHL